MRELKEWLNQHRDEVVKFLILFLISTLSFALGYFVSEEFNRAPIIIEQAGD